MDQSLGFSEAPLRHLRSEADCARPHDDCCVGDGPPGVTSQDSGSVGRAHFLTHGAWLSGYMWRSGSGPPGCDMDKSPLLATSCPHSLGQTSRAGAVASQAWARCRPGARGRQRERGQQSWSPPSSPCTLQQASVITPVGPGTPSARAAGNSDAWLPRTRHPVSQRRSWLGPSLPGAQSLVGKTSHSSQRNKAIQVICF